MPVCLTELGAKNFLLIRQKTLRRSYNWLTTSIWKFIYFCTVSHSVLKNLIILLFQVDPGPCRYYPPFFTTMWRYFTQKLRHLLSVRVGVKYRHSLFLSSDITMPPAKKVRTPGSYSDALQKKVKGKGEVPAKVTPKKVTPKKVGRPLKFKKKRAFQKRRASVGSW